jgi:ribosomal-protein-alanine N-acetyltransferase
VSGIIRGSFQSSYVGYWIGRPFAGHGFMTEALGLVLVFAFRTLGLHRVEANIIPGNRASLRLVKRLGFRYEGTAVRYLRINGRWQDHEHWAITADEPGRR